MVAYMKDFAQSSSIAGCIFINGNFLLLRIEFFEHPALGSSLIFQAEAILFETTCRKPPSAGLHSRHHFHVSLNVVAAELGEGQAMLCRAHQKGNSDGKSRYDEINHRSSALTLPTAFRKHSISTTTKAVSTIPLGTLVGCTVYAELVARHLESLLASAKSLPLADALVCRLACITSWNNASSSTHSTAVSSTNGKFVLSTDALLKRLRPKHPDMAENYLWLRIFKAGDKESSHHTLLAELQLQLLLRYAESKDEEKLFRQRLRFRYTLSHLEDCQTEKLLASLKSSSSVDLFTEEYVTLLGKLNKYDEALRVLVFKEKNLGAALRFCAWCTNIEVHQRLIEHSTLWNHQEIDEPVARSRHMKIPKSNAYTVLLKLLLTSNDPSLLEQSKKLLETEIPFLDFVEILKVLPDDWHIDPAVSAFLANAMRATLTRESKSNIELGLTTQMASASRTEAAVSISRGLPVTDASKCLQCHLPLNAYGDLRPFAWILNQEYSPTSVMHLHCLQSDSVL
ncbi:hypothetical protein ACTXT7_015947 [Hymenolepis weldensis]